MDRRVTQPAALHKHIATRLEAGSALTPEDHGAVLVTERTIPPAKDDEWEWAEELAELVAALRDRRIGRRRWRRRRVLRDGVVDANALKGSHRWKDSLVRKI